MSKHDLLDLIDSVKNKLTSKEYKSIVELLAKTEIGKIKALITIKQNKLYSEFSNDYHDFVINSKPFIISSKVYNLDLECHCNPSKSHKCICCIVKFAKSILNIDKCSAEELGNEELITELNNKYYFSLEDFNAYHLNNGGIFSSEFTYDPIITVDVLLLE